MRKIKFRGKRLTDGKWIYGDFFRNRGLSFIAADGIVENPGDATPSDHLAIQRIVNGEPTVVLVPYEKGLVTATETEIISDEIQDGDRVIFGRYGQSSSGAGGARMGPPM